MLYVRASDTEGAFQSYQNVISFNGVIGRIKRRVERGGESGVSGGESGVSGGESGERKDI